MRTLLVDNHDSYTYNIFQLMAQVYGEEPTVVTNDDPAWPDVDLGDFDAAVISPGPGHPAVRRNLGVSLNVLADPSLPTLGICLGHQAIAHLSGTRVTVAPTPQHGQVSLVRHDGRGLFDGIPQFFSAVRYHSLCVPTARLAPELQATAWAEDGVIMGLRHLFRPLWGVQFHPESVLSEHGAGLLLNFRRLVRARPERKRVAVPFKRPPATTARRWGTTQSGPPTGPRKPATLAMRTESAAGAAVPGKVDNWRLLCREMPQEAVAEQAFSMLFAPSPYAFWLDSSRVEPGLSRFSFLGAPLGPHGEVLSYRVGRQALTLSRPGGSRRVAAQSIFDSLDERLRDQGIASPSLPFNFNGGYVGYFGYEVKSELGSPGRHVAAAPDAVWMSATRLVAIDHEEQRTYLLALARNDDKDSLADSAAWLDAAECALGGLYGRALPTAGSSRSPGPDIALDIDPEPWLRKSRSEYVADIAECQRQLRTGESYEICLTTTMTMPCHVDPLAQYLRQRAHNPSPFAAFLKCGSNSILCSSPERFMRVGTDRVVETKPIKGTSPRDPDPVRDLQLAKELASDLKSRSENLMIVDLMRNDLGRVCEVGSVEVSKLMQVESYATVHQLVSTIRGRLRPRHSAVNCVRACFPGGSMTGAPKLRTMEIIDRLEDCPRGIYSGSLGYFGFNGSADLNIVIRTAVLRGGWMSVGAGGAIVLGSDPQSEYEEMLLKARAALRGMRP